MKMKNHVNELTEGMQRLCAVANRVVAQEGKVSRIDIDLLLEDLRRLYDVALQMSGEWREENEERRTEKGEWREESGERRVEPAVEEKMMAMMSTMAAMQPAPAPAPEPEPMLEPEPMPEPEPEPEPEPVVPEPVVPEPEPEPEPVEMPKMEELEQNDNALLFDEVIIEPEASEERREESGERRAESGERREEPVIPASEPSMATGQASLLDYLSQPLATVGEQPQNMQRTLGERLGAERPQPSSLERKVDDLRTVININDKFSFMSELFHNNMKAYNDFIMHLNALENRDEALAHVSEVAQQQKWDEGSATVQAFYRVFDKKF